MISDELTPKEIEIAKLLADGLTCPEIATRLHNSVRTIESHRVSIYDKLQISSRREIVSYIRKEHEKVINKDSNCSCDSSISVACGTYPSMVLSISTI